jgi:hypothetical protein
MDEKEHELMMDAKRFIGATIKEVAVKVSDDANVLLLTFTDGRCFSIEAHSIQSSGVMFIEDVP